MITTLVGNYPKVGECAYGTKLIGAIKRWQRKESSDRVLEQTFQEITRSVIGEEESAGLDLLTDGQIRGEDLVTPIAKGLDGFEINGYLEGGWDWGEAQGWLVQPMASVQVSFVQLASYTETGGASALAFGEQDMLSIKGSAGLRLTKDVAWTEKHSGKLQVRGRWVHEFGDNSSHVDAHFASNPGATFTVTDEGAAPDSVVIGAGIHTDIGSGDTILLDYDMRVATDESAHILIGQWKHRW